MWDANAKAATGSNCRVQIWRYCFTSQKTMFFIM